MIHRFFTAVPRNSHGVYAARVVASHATIAPPQVMQQRMICTEDEAIRPVQYPGQLVRANLLFAGRQHLQAEAICDRLIHAQPDNGSGYVLKAKLHAIRGEVDNALAAYKRAVQCPGELESPRRVYQHQGALWAEKGNYEEALKAYDQAMEFSKNDEERSQSLAFKADALAQLSREDEALVLYQKALEIYEQCIEPSLTHDLRYSQELEDKIEKLQSDSTLDASSESECGFAAF